MSTCLLLIGACLAAADEPRASVLVVVGAEGTEEYGRQFEQWAGRWEAAARRGNADVTIIGHGTLNEKTDRQQLHEQLAENAGASTEPLWLVLIGHGTFDGKSARFNLRGTDVSAAELAIMRRIDALHLDYPFAGSRMLRDLLRGEGIAIGRERVMTMMRRMGLEAIYRRPHTSKPADGHKVFPYLLRGMPIERPNQVWAMDITYIPMARGFVYLTAVVDWFSRRVLAWRMSISMEVDFCLDAVDEACRTGLRVCPETS